MTALTHAALISALTYDATTGDFRWNVRPSPRSNVAVGDLAGCVDRRNGYVVIRLHGRLYMAHRLAWLYRTGKWPTHPIDHRDGRKGNNAFGNLRDVTNAVNQQNLRSAKRNNSAGLLGVVLSEGRKPRAYITTPDGRRRAIGSFSTPAEAHAAYIAAKRQHHEGNTL